jgi:lipid-A-disaccharide synthase-like uncharacterized protein
VYLRFHVVYLTYAAHKRDIVTISFYGYILYISAYELEVINFE